MALGQRLTHSFKESEVEKKWYLVDASGKTLGRVASRVAHVLRGTGKTVGMTCTDGIYLNGRRVSSEDCSGPISARSVLMNPNTEIAVLETARGGLLRAGLGFDQYLKEAYFSYLAPVGKGLQVDVGKFVTPHGAAGTRITGG